MVGSGGAHDAPHGGRATPLARGVRYNRAMSTKSRRKRVRARERARGDRPPLPGPRTGPGPLFDWTQAGVRDLVLLQRAISTGRLTPCAKGRRIVAAVVQMVLDDAAVAGDAFRARREVEGFRVALACERDRVRKLKALVDGLVDLTRGGDETAIQALRSLFLARARRAADEYEHDAERPTNQEPPKVEPTPLDKIRPSEAHGRSPQQSRFYGRAVG